MPKLILLRHLKSQWNKENRFAGWIDVPLSKEGIDSAKEVADRLVGIEIDKVYTSPIAKNKDTAFLILNELGKKNTPIVMNKVLDERNYGILQGLNKDDVKKQYGEEQVQLWRRSWNQAPPQGESLEDVYNRAVPFFKKEIEKDLESGKNVFVVASHNSLRALVKYIEKISDDEIINLEIPWGSSLKYEFKGGVYKKLD